MEPRPGGADGCAARCGCAGDARAGPGSYAAGSSFQAATPALSPTKHRAMSPEKTFRGAEPAGRGDPGRQAFRASAAYSFGLKKSDKTFISREHSRAEQGSSSPGPKYHPNSERTRLPSYSFGTAGRDAGKLRYTSEEHSREKRGQDTPGPGTYRSRQGKGIAKTIGDAPTFKFGTAASVGDAKVRTRLSPGPGAHVLPSTIGDSPAYSFSPMNSLNKGMGRSRDESNSIYISETHSRGSTKKTGSGNDQPGPGEYKLRSCLGDSGGPHLIDCSKSSVFNPSFSFPKSKPGANIYISKQHATPDKCSPGPLYTVPSGIAADGGKTRFGTEQRFFSPEEGGASGGPLISSLHSEAIKGAHSPGPVYYPQEDDGYYVENGESGTKAMNAGKTVKFGTEDRFSSKDSAMFSSSTAPGPGAYTPKYSAESSGGGGTFKFQPQFSMASCIRSNFIASDTDQPGPGAYDTCTGFETRDIRKNRAPTAKFGKDNNRGTFIFSPKTPGPGQYGDDVARSKRGGAAFSFGPTRGIDFLSTNSKDAARPGTSPLPNRPKFETPGPGRYTLPSGKGIKKTLGDAPTFGFGTSKRGSGKLYISSLHSKQEGGQDSPGPGSYKPGGLGGNSNKFRNRSGFSFGTSKRPSMASIKF